ncbi:hypothetical protein RB195_005634 [Necator americanus]|uniref:Uncharacterized protein n=1 Tax=Necator americanus TaxID=51031 RepID=A0ABR1BS74_NECAM
MSGNSVWGPVDIVGRGERAFHAARRQVKPFIVYLVSKLGKLAINQVFTTLSFSCGPEENWWGRSCLCITLLIGYFVLIKELLGLSKLSKQRDVQGAK